MNILALEKIISDYKKVHERTSITDLLGCCDVDVDDFLHWAFDDCHEQDINMLRRAWNRLHGHRFYVSQCSNFSTALDEMIRMYYER